MSPLLPPRNHRCVVVLAVLGAALGSLGRLSAEDNPPSHPILEAFARKARRSEEGPRQLWHLLARYARRGLSAPTPRDETFWRGLAADSCVPLKLPSYTLKVGVRFRSVQAFPVEFQPWLLPAPGRVFLFAHPVGNDGKYVLVYQEVSKAFDEVKQGLRTGPAAALPDRRKLDEAEAEQNALTRVGAERFALVLLPFFTGEAGSTAVPEVELTSDGVRVTLEGKTRVLPLPPGSRLEQSLGVPFEPPELPDLAQVYFALDWSRYMANPVRRKRLVAELQNALARTPEERFCDGGVFLQANAQAVCWPLREVKQGRLPEELAARVQPHESSTLETLAAALEAADQRGKRVRVTFLTLLPMTSIPDDRQNLSAVLEPNGRTLLERARQTDLHILQLFPKRLACFETLAGPHYHEFEFRDVGLPSLTLPARD